MMLSQFRMRYPQGCLIGELVTIDRGKYIVRVLVQNEGMMLGSGLGTGDTPEEAEDKARERALGVINLDALPTLNANSQETPHQITARVDSPKASLEPEKPPKASSSGKKNDKSFDVQDVSLSSPKVSQPPLKETVKVISDDLILSQPPLVEALNQETKKPISKETVTGISEDLNPSQPPLVLKDEVLDQKTKKRISKGTVTGISEDLKLSQPPLVLKDEVLDQETKEQISEVLPSPIPSETTPPITPLVEPVVLDNVLSLSSEETSETLPESENVSPVTLEPPIEEISMVSVNVEEMQETVPLETSSSTEELESLDFSEIIARSNVELKRLRWTNEQGREYLLKTYGKRSRQVLDDKELLEFLHHLESLATPN